MFVIMEFSMKQWKLQSVNYRNIEPVVEWSSSVNEGVELHKPGSSWVDRYKTLLKPQQILGYNCGLNMKPQYIVREKCVCWGGTITGAVQTFAWFWFNLFDYVDNLHPSDRLSRPIYKQRLELIVAEVSHAVATFSKYQGILFFKYQTYRSKESSIQWLKNSRCFYKDYK